MSMMVSSARFGAGVPVPVAGQFSPTGVGGSYGSFTLSGGNLTVTVTAADAGAKGYPFRSSGKYYFELTPVSGNIGNGFFVLGMATQAITNAATVFPAATSSVVGLSGNSNIYIANTAVGVGGSNAAGRAVCIAVDLTAGLIWFRQGSGIWNNSGTANPATGVGGINIASVLANGAIAPFIADGTVGAFAVVVTANLGGSAFAQTAPSGFAAWN